MRAPNLLLVLMLPVLGCSSTESTVASSPFADTFVRRVAGTPELCLIVNERPRGGADALDAFVADHAELALKEADRCSETNLKVVFFFKDGPTSNFGCWGGFSRSLLQSIVKGKHEGKTFRSLQDWPSMKLPKRSDAESGAGR